MIQVENIPEEIKEKDRWILWVKKEIENKFTKIPVNERCVPVSIVDENNLMPFDKAYNYYKELESRLNDNIGLGFVFNGDGIIGIDLDEVIENNSLKKSAIEIINSIDSYIEKSPSGKGIHFIGRVNKEIQSLKKVYDNLRVEIYPSKRFFTVTGQVLSDSIEIKDITKSVEELISKINLQEKINLFFKTFPQYRKLYLGNIEEVDGDLSRADYKLVSALYKYFSDEKIVDSIYRTSALFRPKWDEKRGEFTYGQLTLNKVKVLQKTETIHTNSIDVERLSVDSLWDNAMNFREHGFSKGFSTGWVVLDDFYRPAPSSLSVLVGTPGAGKTTFLDNLAINMAKLHGWKFCFLSFETVPVERHLLRLMQIYLKKPIFKFLPGSATDEECLSAKNFLDEHFFFLFPKEYKVTMDNLIEMLSDELSDHSINSFILDPFTELDLDLTRKNCNEVRAIEMDLAKLQKFTRVNRIHTIVSVHPTKNSDNYKSHEKGQRPTLYSASGAAHFRNKADFGLVLHRWDDGTTTLFIDKVRNDINGSLGEVNFIFNSEQKTFLEYF